MIPNWCSVTQHLMQKCACGSMPERNKEFLRVLEVASCEDTCWLVDSIVRVLKECHAEADKNF